MEILGTGVRATVHVPTNELLLQVKTKTAKRALLSPRRACQARDQIEGS